MMQRQRDKAMDDDTRYAQWLRQLLEPEAHSDICQTCGLPSDLGNKCRRCYLKWQRELSKELHGALEHYQRTVAVMQAKASAAPRLAEIALGHRHERLSGQDADIMLMIRRALDGPYEQAMRNALFEWARSKQGGKRDDTLD
jgi:hypothetical protein